MRESIPYRFKIPTALQVLLVAVFLVCAGGAGGWANTASDQAIDTLTPKQKIACNEAIRAAKKSLPPSCSSDLKVTEAMLIPYDGGLEVIGYESAFCGSTKAKLTATSAQTLFDNICKEGKDPKCERTVKSLAASDQPIARFSCGVTRVYSRSEYQTDWYKGTVGVGNAASAPEAFTNKLEKSASAARANEAQAGKQAATLAEIQANFSQICFACGLVSRLYTTSIVYGEAVTAAIGREVVKLMGIGFALYMVFVAAKLFFPFGPQDKMVGLANKLSISLMITVALSFLYLTDTSYKFYWNYIYNPIVDAAINMNDQLLNEGSGDGTFFGRLNAQNIVCKTVTNVDVTKLTPEQIASKNKLECQVHKLQYVFTYGLATGIYIGLQGSYISGGILIAIYAFAPLVFAFAIIDALMRWTFMSVLSPALMACACFPLTRKYAYLGVRVMLEAAISFVVVAVIAVIISGMMEQSLSALNDKLGEKNLPKWLEDSLKTPSNKTTPAVAPKPTAPPTTLPNPSTTTGQLENGAAVVAAADFNESYQGDGEQDYVTAMLSGVVDKNTIGFPPQYPQRTTLTESGMREVYEDKELAGTLGSFTCKVKPMVGIITTPFGWRPERGRNHYGIDIAEYGTPPIVATADGIVEFVGWDGGYGNAVKIRHPDHGIFSTYNHILDGSITVKMGQKVTAGQTLGAQGSTGTSTGPHLHFELRRGDMRGEPFDPLPCIDGKPMPNGTFSPTLANGNPAAALFSAPAFDFSDSGFMILCAAGLLAGFLRVSWGNIGAQFLGGQTFGVSSGGALSNMAAAGAQWAGALGGVGMGFARNALTPTTNSNATGNPVRDMLMQNNLTAGLDQYLENSGAYNRAGEFVDNAKTAIENNPVVKGVTDKVDELKAGLEAFSQSRAGQITDAALSGAAAVAGVGAGALGVAATGIVSMTENLAMQQAMRVLEATGYAELAGAVGGGFAQGVGTGMSWVPENRTVFINREVVKQYIATQGSIRDAQDRVEAKAFALAAMDDVNSKGYIQDDAERKIAKDRLALELYRATAELKLLELAAKYDVTGRYNIQLQKEAGFSRGEADEALKGKIDTVAEQERRFRSFEKTLKQDAENVRYTPEIEQAIIAASVKGFSNTPDKGLQKVAGYKEKDTAGAGTQSSLERSDASGSFVNNSESDRVAETRDRGQSGRVSANADDDKKSSSSDARNNIVAAKGLLKKKSAAQKKPEAANNIARFVRRKQEQDLVAAGRNRDSNSNNDDDDKGGAS
jgi:murein DD-endopeptidase MepM/ murein hydrolase activator NlpD